MSQPYRIIDANLNRAREALRVAEEYARFILNDSRLSAMAKTMRSDLQRAAAGFDQAAFLGSRDTAADVGTAINSSTEAARPLASDIAVAACKRLQEALRAIEEYSKFVAADRACDVKPASFERLRYDSYIFEQLLCGAAQLRLAFKNARIYVLLTSSMCSQDPVLCAHAAIAGGADCLQLREKNMPDEQMLQLAKRLRAITRESQTLFIVNDRPDIAALSDADGVHVGQGDLPVAAARQIVGGDKLVGLSTHSLAQAKLAAGSGQVADMAIAPDYIGVGPMFETATKAAEPVRGTQLMAEIAAADLGIDHVAIGGINAENAAEVARRGASRIAVCSAVISAADPKSATEQIRHNFLTELSAS